MKYAYKSRYIGRVIYIFITTEVQKNPTPTETTLSRYATIDEKNIGVL